MCLAGKGAGVVRGSHGSPGRGWKEQDTALCVNPMVLCVQAPSCHLSPVECVRALTKARSTSPADPQESWTSSLWKQGTSGKGRGVHMASEVGCICNFCYPANVKSH